MGQRAGTAVAAHRPHDAGQQVLRIADRLHHRGGRPVVLAHPQLEDAVDDPADLQAVELGGHDAVLDDHVRTRLAQRRHRQEVGGGRLDRRRERRRVHGLQLGADDAPHRRRVTEVGRVAGGDAGRVRRRRSAAPPASTSTCSSPGTAALAAHASAGPSASPRWPRSPGEHHAPAPVGGDGDRPRHRGAPGLGRALEEATRQGPELHLDQARPPGRRRRALCAPSGRRCGVVARAGKHAIG